MKRNSGSELEAISGDNGGIRFRVKVCMKQFFSDERANAYVCVREEHNVRWLHRRLRTLFSLPPRFLLLSRGHLLPPDEPLAILERDDTVDVVPARAEVDAVTNQVTPKENSCDIENVASALESGIGDSDTTTPFRSERNIFNSANISIESKDEVDPCILPYDGNELKERKRRALAMLEKVCGESEDAPLVVRPRRRRVRRRRRAAPQPDTAEDCTPAPEDDNSARSSSPDCNGSEPARDASVLRNGYQKSRVPRVIRPLEDNMT